MAWLQCVGVETLCIEQGSPGEDGCVKSFNRRLRDELLNQEICCTLREAHVLIGAWRQEYCTLEGSRS